MAGKLLKQQCTQGRVKNAQQEKEREKTVQVDSAISTQWKLYHTKTACANSNQLDLETAIRRPACPHGVDSELYKDTIDDLDSVFITESDRKCISSMIWYATLKCLHYNFSDS